MNKLNKKDVIQHSLLNLLTIINVEISNLKINAKKKEKIENLISTASILIANESIFLNLNPDLFIQNASLKEIIEITCKILDSEIKKQSISIKIPKDDYIVKVDKFYFSEAFKYLLKKLIDDSTKIEFKFNQSKNILEIIHNKKTNFEQPVEDLSNYLKSKNINKEDITFQLACTIIKIHKIDMQFNKNLIQITF